MTDATRRQTAAEGMRPPVRARRAARWCDPALKPAEAGADTEQATSIATGRQKRLPSTVDRSTPAAPPTEDVHVRSEVRLAWSAELLFLLFALLLIIAQPASAAAAPEVGHAPAAAWIEAHQPDLRPIDPPGEVSNGMHYLLVDRQVDVHDTGDDAYTHVAYRLLNAAGVGRGAEISMAVDPSYQHIDIHRLWVRRAGEVLDMSGRARILALPNEPDREAGIYSGGYRVSVLLPDVRVGDVVEYDYTVASRNTLFPGIYGNLFHFGWTAPVESQVLRIRSLHERPLRYRVFGGQAQGVVERGAAHDELRFEWTREPPARIEDQAPEWVVMQPYVQVSDAANWSVVARRVSELFEVDAPYGSAVAALIEQLRAMPGTPLDRATAAIQLVEETVRYTSVSIGEGSYRPTRPDEVLARLFGDCKDKSLLLVTLLRGLGMDASVALVSTRNGVVLDRQLPSPLLFDHAIVQLREDGRDWWIDPTRSREAAPLAHAAAIDFRQALRVLDTTTGLTAIARPPAGADRREVSLEFDASAGDDAPVPLTVTTRYHAGLADSMRQTLSDGSTANQSESFLDYYRGYYPEITLAAPFEVEDDTVGNVLTVVEHYQLPKAFVVDEGGRPRMMLHADEMYPYAEAMPWHERTLPLALDYPDSVHQHITVLLPRDWAIAPDAAQVDNPAFSYRSEVRYADRRLDLDYHYEALDSIVLPADYTAFAAARRSIADDAGFRLYDTAGAGEPQPPLSWSLIAWIVAASGLIGGGLLSSRFVRRTMLPADDLLAARLPTAPHWLVSAGVAAGLVPLLVASAIVLLVGENANAGTLAAGLADQWSAPIRISWLALLLIGGMLLPASAAIAVLVLRYRSGAPRLMLMLSWALWLFWSACGVHFALGEAGPVGSVALWVGSIAGQVAICAALTWYLRHVARARAQAQRDAASAEPALPLARPPLSAAFWVAEMG